MIQKRPSFTQLSVHNHLSTDPSRTDGDFKVQVKEGRRWKWLEI